MRALQVLFALVSLPALAAGLNDSGVTTCFDGSKLVACTATDTGDALATAGRAAVNNVTSMFASSTTSRYTKIANNGTALPESAALGSGSTAWACTRDNSTGLIWEVKTADGGLRDWKKTYTNYDDPTQLQKRIGGVNKKPTQADIDATGNSIGLVKTVNTGGLCGSVDWRRPSTDELLALVDTSVVGADSPPKINPAFFPNTPSLSGSFFWSSLPSSTGTLPHFASGVSFRNAVADSHDRSDGSSVRLVRGVPSTATFTLWVYSFGATSVVIGAAPTTYAGTTEYSKAGIAAGTNITLIAPATKGTR